MYVKVFTLDPQTKGDRSNGWVDESHPSIKQKQLVNEKLIRFQKREKEAPTYKTDHEAITTTT